MNIAVGEALPPASRLASFFSLWVGCLFDGIERILFYPKITMPMARFWHKIIFLYFIVFFLERSWLLVFHKLSFGMMIYNLTQVVVANVVLVTLSNVSYRRKQIYSFTKNYTERFRKQNYSPKREQSLRRSMRFLDITLSMETILMVVPRLIILPSILIRRKPYVPTPFMGDDDGSWKIIFVALFQGFLTIYHALVSIGFDAVLHTLILTVSNEMIHMGDALSEIFNYIDIDIDGNLFIKTLDMRNRSKVSYISVLQRDNPALYGQILVRQKELLRTWIEQYCLLLEMSRGMKTWFSPAIFVKYVSVATFICSMILGDVWRNVTPLAIFNNMLAYLSMALCLYVSCYYGDSFQLSFRSIHKNILGTKWPFYPLEMKKDLHMILILATKEHQMNISGLFPLSLTTFLQVVKIAYSLMLLVIQVGYKKKIRDLLGNE